MTGGSRLTRSPETTPFRSNSVRVPARSGASADAIVAGQDTDRRSRHSDVHANSFHSSIWPSCDSHSHLSPPVRPGPMQPIGRFKGGSSHDSPGDPVSIPHDNENRGVATGIDHNGIHRSAPLSHLRRSSQNAPGHALKVETRVQIPLGLRRSEAISGASRERVAPHWPRGAHEAVTTRCSVTRPKNHVDST